MEIKGSIWITVNASGKAACPHCQKLAWVSGNQWNGCKHAIGPGSEKGTPAIIFKGEA